VAAVHQSDLVEKARGSFLAALAACEVEPAVAARVRVAGGSLAVPGGEVDLTRYGEIRIAAIGKAADRMLAAFGRALDCGPPVARRALVITHTESGEKPPWATRMVGGHPVPDRRSFEAGRALLAFFDGCTSETLAVFLLSGGGSALAEWPLAPTVGWEDLCVLNDVLVRSNLPIRSINAVRKHVSAIKGGRLAARAAPADQLTLVVSDVAPGDVQSVASGPTVVDDTTVDDVARALDTAGLRDRIPAALRAALAPDSIAETPTVADLGGGLRWVASLLDSSSAAEAARRDVERYAAAVALLDGADGWLEQVVDAHLSALEGLARDREPGSVCAVVSAGEATLDVTGDGVGGRNQHSVLYALTRVGDLCPSVGEYAVLSAGTDGRDGPTDAAGAVAGPALLAEARARGLDPTDFLRRFDAYGFFRPLGGLVVTGPTGTNVRDVRIFLGTTKR
jgi:hydroxypyruvate reductase